MWLNPVFVGDGTSQLTCGFVRFTPGARTNWHSHVNGQLNDEKDTTWTRTPAAPR